MEEAKFSRIQGQIAKNAARLKNIETISKAGTSLLATSNFGQKKITDYFPKRDKGILVGDM